MDCRGIGEKSCGHHPSKGVPSWSRKAPLCAGFRAAIVRRMAVTLCSGLSGASGAPLAVVEIQLLFETGADQMVDAVADADQALANAQRPVNDDEK